MTPEQFEAICARDDECACICVSDHAMRLAAYGIADRRALIEYVKELKAAAGKVTCAHCNNYSGEGYVCPDCTDLRRLIKDE